VTSLYCWAVHHNTVTVSPGCVRSSSTNKRWHR
jgi:hypothetical protein